MPEDFKKFFVNPRRISGANEFAPTEYRISPKQVTLKRYFNDQIKMEDLVYQAMVQKLVKHKQKEEKDE